MLSPSIQTCPFGTCKEGKFLGGRIIEKKQKLHTKQKIANSKKKKKTQKIANHIERTYTLKRGDRKLFKHVAQNPKLF